jgi:hypothetical protein
MHQKTCVVVFADGYAAAGQAMAGSPSGVPNASDGRTRVSAAPPRKWNPLWAAGGTGLLLLGG